ncbi:acyl-CoA Delta-9 desaturase-like [Macrosteles quadrilineatus]|uniref:acyl-CoA Delta-9 desaturase-like n=1 Tax=Macrosteles quadrilineatus TaxID=74068 RepID=UPI0023E21822|nr:acyl-CoA Delta-9 desaturase-like [Macrosteles quadrilineatus]
MPPQTTPPNGITGCQGEKPLTDNFSENYEGEKKFKAQIVWKNVAYLGYFHLAALYGLYLALTSAKLATILFAIFIFIASGLGVTCGAHRLWTHRAFKANFGLRVALMILNSMAFEDSVYEWARNHRVHHKFSETDADPHNTKRGFFFSHVGWLMLRKHPDVIEKGKTIDMSDLLQDPVLVFQRKYYKYLMPLLCFGFPTVVPVLLWSETWNNAFHVSAMLRYVYLLNCVWLVNSAAHFYGARPYDNNMEPRENVTVAVMTLGEGWHNYHHAFPWDYRSSELGYFRFNFTTRFIDFCAKMGWAHDLKSASLKMVQQRAKRTGDGTYTNPFPHSVWGWGDKDMCADDICNSVTLHERKLKAR